MTDARAPRSVGCDMAGILDKRWVVMCVRLLFYSLVEGCAVCPRSRPESNAAHAGDSTTNRLSAASAPPKYLTSLDVFLAEREGFEPSIGFCPIRP